MTDQEKINENLQRQIDAQNARVGNVLTKVDMLITELRDRDNQRAEEIRELRQKQDSDMREMRQDIKNLQTRIEDMGKHVRNLAWTGMAAIGGMFVAVGAMVATVIYTILKS